MGKHRRKHKHHQHKGCCGGQQQHKCSENCKCEKNKIDVVEITTQAELSALLNLIMRNGKEREERQALEDSCLADDMKADAENDTSTTPLTTTEKVI